MAALAAALALLTPVATQAAPLYTLTDLGDLPGGADYSIATGINNLGHVVGYSGTATGTRAFLWKDGVGMTNLGDLPGGLDQSYATGINDSGQVVGGSAVAESGRAFLWQDGIMTNLGTLPGGGTWGSGSDAKGINNSGQVVGFSYDAIGPHAVLWQDGVISKLDNWPANALDFGTGINNSGQVVGTSWVGATAIHAFLWDGGTLTDLGALPGGDLSIPNGINDRGQIVGHSAIASGKAHAFLWDSVNSMLDLNDLLTDPSGWELTTANAINDSGQIVGWGEHDGVQRGFLLTPVDMAPPHPAAAPDTLDLARLALHVYPDSRSTDIGDFESLGVIPGGEFDLRLPFAEAFIRRGENGGRDQIVISIRGTQTWVDALRDLEISGIPPILLDDMLASVAGFTGAIRSQHPLADFTFTGHSLGGAAATILATISGVDAVTFNSPGTHNLISNDRRDALAALVGHPVSESQDVTNYRHSIDPVSILGAPEGGVLTVHDVAFEALPPSPVPCLPCHSMAKMVDLLVSGAAQTPGYTPSLLGDIAVVFPNAFAIGGVRKFFNALTDGGFQLFDPHLVGDAIEIDLGLSDVMINGILVGGLPGDEFPLQAFSDDAWFDIGTLFSYVPMDVASYPKYRIYNASKLVDDFGNYIIGLRFDGVGTFRGSIGMIETTPSVPEPVTLSLLGAGLAGLGWMRRRRAA